MSGLAVLTSLAVALQAILMSVDELKFHRARGLGWWESWGHPVDSFFFLVPLSFAALFPPTPGLITAYVMAAIFSSLVITKDEWVHSAECEPAEHFLHALLFVIHPSILFGMALLWIAGQAPTLRTGTPVAVALFALYQWRYWVFVKTRPKVDNTFYETLGDRWYDDDTHAIALLRVEAGKKIEYVLETLHRRGIAKGASVLDIGCGAGFIANPLAAAGFHVKGVDYSASSVAVARERAPQGSLVSYEAQDAYALQEKDESWDVALMLDFLEHVEDPRKAIREATRVLKPGGLLVVHTFNRTPAARLLAIHGISFVAKDCPPHVHVYSLFIKPSELSEMGREAGLEQVEFRGVRPKILCRSFFWSLLHRRVHPGFSFVFSRSLTVGYLGYFQKQAQSPEVGC